MPPPPASFLCTHLLVSVCTHDRAANVRVYQSLCGLMIVFTKCPCVYNIRPYALYVHVHLSPRYYTLVCALKFVGCKVSVWSTGEYKMFSLVQLVARLVCIPVKFESHLYNKALRSYRWLNSWAEWAEIF